MYYVHSKIFIINKVLIMINVFLFLNFIKFFIKIFEYFIFFFLIEIKLHAKNSILFLKMNENAKSIKIDVFCFDNVKTRLNKRAEIIDIFGLF